MQLEWILNPVTVYALASSALLVSLVLFVSIKREMAIARQLVGESQEARAADQAMVRALQAELEVLRESVVQLEAAPPVRPAGLGINLTKRAQALRMYRRGELIPSIAAALETPTDEIELLLKVHALTSEAQRVN